MSKTLSTKDVSEALGVSKQRVNQMIKAGKLPASLVDGKYRIEQSAVEALRSQMTARPRKDRKQTWKVTITATIEIERDDDDEPNSTDSDEE
jgi:excisionase family DNA binding protein